jgi:aminoglycoside phosphotransferase (APT) family kinase protein
MINLDVIIDISLVSNLIAAQFSQWKHLSIRPVDHGGWDNRTFHLGDQMLVRMPSGPDYAAKIAKEQEWLPKLAPLLPLPIPTPLAMGMPAEGYPWHWSIYRWIEGESAATAPIINLCDFAQSLAQFLVTLQKIDPTGGPKPGPHNFYRGGDLQVYDAETRQALAILKDRIDADAAATKVWEAALETSWQRNPVWVHGDISAGNLLVKDDTLCAVIDFGGLAIGDPACDLAIAWTLFEGESRDVFRATLPLDEGTWARGRAWTLWKALIIAAGLTKTNAIEGTRCWRIIGEILADQKQT